MASWSRTQACSGCGVVLLVPPNARTIRCALCRALTNVRPSRPISLLPRVLNAYSSGHQANWLYRSDHCNPTIAMGPPPRYPSVRGNKRALLVGVSYLGRRYELQGTVNDVNCMKYFLRENFGFPEDCILVLTEEEKDPNRIPTRRNIEAAMRWLISDVCAGASLVFHFAGHGSQRPSSTGDEADGFDETLCPLDYETEGMIIDDEINETLVRPLPAGARLHAVVDSCHSGTALDLPYLCRMNRGGYYQWEDHNTSKGVYKGTSGGLAISVSGCDDHQTSADTSALSRDVTTGAMTYAFIHAVISEPGLTYGRLLSAMRSTIRGADTGIRVSGPIVSLLKKVFNFGLNQEPQLASSERFDIYRKPFIL